MKSLLRIYALLVKALLPPESTSSLLEINSTTIPCDMIHPTSRLGIFSWMKSEALRRN